MREYLEEKGQSVKEVPKLVSVALSFLLVAFIIQQYVIPTYSSVVGEKTLLFMVSLALPYAVMVWVSFKLTYSFLVFINKFRLYMTGEFYLKKCTHLYKLEMKIDKGGYFEFVFNIGGKYHSLIVSQFYGQLFQEGDKVPVLVDSFIVKGSKGVLPLDCLGGADIPDDVLMKLSAYEVEHNIQFRGKLALTGGFASLDSQKRIA